MSKKKIGIIGLYGTGNLGDDLILLSVLKHLDRNLNLGGNEDKLNTIDIEILYFGKEKNLDYLDLCCKSYNISLFYKLRVFNLIWFICKKIKSMDLIIYAGGGFINERQPLLRLLWWLLPIFIGVLFKKRVLLISLSVNHSFRNRFLRLILKKLLDKVDAITVRDVGSMEKLKKYLGLSKTEIISVADVVWTFSSEFKKNRSSEDIKKFGLCLVDYYSGYGLSTSLYKSYYACYKSNIIDSLKDLYRNLWSIGVKNLEFINTTRTDYEFIEDIKKELEKELNINISNFYSKDPQKVFEYFGYFDVVLAMRFHSIIISLSLDLLVVPIIYENKVKNLVSELGIEDYSVDYIDFSTGLSGKLPVLEITRKVKKIIDEEEKFKEIVKLKKDYMKRKANLNFEILDKYLI